MKSLRLARIGCAVASMFGTSIASRFTHTYRNLNTYRECVAAHVLHICQLAPHGNCCARIVRSCLKIIKKSGTAGGRAGADDVGHLNKLPMCAAVERFERGRGVLGARIAVGAWIMSALQLAPGDCIIQSCQSARYEIENATQQIACHYQGS